MTIASSKTPIGANAASHTETMTELNFIPFHNSRLAHFKTQPDFMRLVYAMTASGFLSYKKWNFLFGNSVFTSVSKRFFNSA